VHFLRESSNQDSDVQRTRDKREKNLIKVINIIGSESINTRFIKILSILFQLMEFIH